MDRVATGTRLSVDTWSRVASFLVQDDAHAPLGRSFDDRTCQRDLLSMATVCKGLHLAATRHLYSRVQVKDLAAFLYGLDAGGATCPSGMESIGPTKRSALQHVRHLCLVTDYGEIAMPGGEGESTETKKKEDEIFFETALHRVRSFERAAHHLGSIQSTLLPQLESVQVGQQDFYREYNEPEWLEVEPRWLGPLILRTCRPKYWCQYGSSGAYSQPMQSRPTDYNDRILPQVYVAHVNISEDFGVLWGTKNRIFLHKDMNYVYVSSTLGRAGLVTWLVNNISSSYPGWLDEVQSPTKVRVEQDTKIEICGLARCLPLAHGPDDIFPGHHHEDRVRSSEEVIRLIGATEQAVRLGCRDRLDLAEEVADRFLDFIVSSESPPCPSCFATLE